jgi:hypothetical protein
LAEDNTLSREAIAKSAKAATVLVEAKPSCGSGFCVHVSGLFVTDEHVVRNAGDVTLVLNAGRAEQKVVKAKVLRRDKARDLALLKAEGEEKFQFLELGSDKELSELTELIAFGFPFGTNLAPQGEYPAISVNVGSVTSLRNNKNKELERIQLDAALNPGNSGGPVLDRKGKVVGVVVSGIPGSGVNMAIPVSHVQRFLARPEVLFTPPAIKAANQHDQFEFTAKTVSLLSATEALELELLLGAGPGKERRFPMKLVDGVYRTKAAPFPRQEGPLSFRVEVKFDDGSVTGTVEDRAVHIGEKEVKLSQVRRLRPGLKPEAQVGDGQRLEGKLGGLEELSLKVGKQTLRLDLASAKEIIVETPEEVTALSCEIVARLAGKEVGRHSVPLYIEGVSRPTMENLAEGKFIKPVRSDNPVSSLRVVSSKGDYIGAGKNYSYGSEDWTVQTNNRGVNVNVAGWMISFGGPGNKFLDVGEYDGAKRFPFSGDAPGIEFMGNGRGCNMISGKFVVWEIEVKGNQVVRLAIDFIQRCEEKMPPLYGSLRINSSFH